MTTPVTPRPAATVMLLSDTADGLKVFLLQRHSKMDFAPNMTVFPGGGVDDRDRNADIDWAGPPPTWWAQRLGVDEELALALVCAAVRETFEECGVLLAGPTGDQVVAAPTYHAARPELTSGKMAFGDFLRRENLVLRADLLRPWANWVTPPAGHVRRYDTYFFVAALPQGQHADGETTEAVSSGWSAPADAIEDFATGGRLLLPPTWTQLDSLAIAAGTGSQCRRPGGSVTDVLAIERDIVAVRPEIIGSEGNWSVDFFDSERYEQALCRRRQA